MLTGKTHRESGLAGERREDRGREFSQGRQETGCPAQVEGGVRANDSRRTTVPSFFTWAVSGWCKDCLKLAGRKRFLKRCHFFLMASFWREYRSELICWQSDTKGRKVINAFGIWGSGFKFPSFDDFPTLSELPFSLLSQVHISQLRVLSWQHVTQGLPHSRHSKKL